MFKVGMESGREMEKSLMMSLTKLKNKETTKRLTSLRPNMNKIRGIHF
jgi:hypothetical protein